MLTHTTRRWAFLALAGTLLIAGCGADDGTTDSPAADGTAPAELDGQSLDADDFAALAATDGVVLLDVRTPQEFAEGHLEGAVNLDVEATDFAARAAELDPDASYAVYCRSGNRSQAAMLAMRSAGVTAAADLAGGIGAWTQAGLPVVTGS
jgi:rhodanese-related sulfurtransferase